MDSEPAVHGLWLLPAALLMLGLAFEGLRQRSLGIEAVAATPARARLGRAFDLALTWRSARPATLRFMPDVPGGIETEARIVTVSTGAEITTTTLAGLPVSLGRWRWPVLRARARGAFGLAWWTRRITVAGETAVEPDLRAHARRGRSLAAGGPAQRALVGSGSELNELREYRRGDPLRSIDWKASARSAAGSRATASPTSTSRSC